jgi:ubiquinone/menaquinone biosynthesis C-methylase UbiE
MVAILGGTREFIFKAVEQMYTEVATQPERTFHFPTGRLACLFVGYPAAQLDRIPATAAESFAGVGYPFSADVVREGDVVLDIGSGSGTDTLIASLLTGERGTVYGLDMTEAMRAKLHRNVALMKATNVQVIEGNAERLPLPDASVDVVTSNGVLNLVPDKPAAFAEIVRVLKPGGRLQLADIALRSPVSEQSRSDPRLWAECVVGAIVEDEYISLLQAAGLEVEVIRRMDYFAGSVSESTRRAAHGLGAHAIVMSGTKVRDMTQLPTSNSQFPTTPNTQFPTP